MCCLPCYYVKKIECLNLLVFRPLLKISLGNPYLKILEPSKLFVADTPMKNNSFTSSQSTLKYWPENHPLVRGLRPHYEYCRAHFISSISQNEEKKIMNVFSLLILSANFIGFISSAYMSEYWRYEVGSGNNRTY